MGKAVFFFSAICMLAFVNFAQSHGGPVTFDVVGSVYCDTCRVQFATKLSEQIQGATVRLACRDMETEQETFTASAVTDALGKYQIKVEGDHEKEYCEVSVEKSPREDCKEATNDIKKQRVVCSGNVGMHSDIRYANPLFFMKSVSVAGCKDVLEELGLFPLEFN